MNPLIKPDDIIAPFATERMASMIEQGQPLVLILDQTKINQRHQMLMLALRVGERALPVAWRVVATQGAIGFEVQKDLLTAALAWDRLVDLRLTRALHDHVAIAKLSRPLILPHFLRRTGIHFVGKCSREVQHFNHRGHKFRTGREAVQNSCEYFQRLKQPISALDKALQPTPN